MKGTAPQRVHRPLTLFDLMALTAATAVGLAAYFSVAADLSPRLNRSHPELLFLSIGVVKLVELTPLIACLSLAILGLHLRPPRPRLRLLTRRPGFSAGLAVLASLTMGLWLLAPLTIALGLVKSREMLAESAVLIIACQAGIGVATTWLSMYLGGRWRAQPQWIDIAGVAIGIYWIALSMAIGFVLITDML